jgi:serine protease
MQERHEVLTLISQLFSHGLRSTALIALLITSVFCLTEVNAQEAIEALNVVHTPTNITPHKNSRPIVVAVVDDGVRISHQDLAGFIWVNPGERAKNRKDDDGNGFVDDINGWDVSDGDDMPTPPEERLEEYSHGTLIASIITQVARQAYGDVASQYIRIMPVKTLSDMEDTRYLKDGFEGIRYAMDAGADIIVCAWGVGHISAREKEILEEANRKGVLIIASAGNFPQELEQYPAAHRPVVAVTALDENGKVSEKSTYGQFVDLTAPGKGIRGASTLSDTAYQTKDGSSFSTAITAGAAALVKVQHPEYSAVEIKACLLTSADAMEIPSARLNGKLGAGTLNIEAAVQCDFLAPKSDTGHRALTTKGYLRLDVPGRKKHTWEFEPVGEFEGIRFWPVVSGQALGAGFLKFYSDPSTTEDLIGEFDLADLPESIFVPGSSASVTLKRGRGKRSGLRLLEYETETIDFSERYCSGTLKIDTEGIIEDGSGPDEYSPGSSCKWLITAPPGQVVHFNFTKMDTEFKTDFIHFFDGEGTHEAIMAMFSGSDIPPQLTSWRNQVLVWFVTDRENQGKGWKAEVRFETPE